VTRLVYFERFDYIRDAIARQTEIKRMLRAQKIALIESMNPQWQDLSEE
jgi:putative endonuclease